MILIFFLTTLLIISTYVIINLYSKLQKLETQLKNEVEPVEKAYLIYENLLKLLIRSKVELDSIDKRGTYSSDDEVGFAFKIIQGSIENLVEEIKKISNADAEKDKN